jgi:hypothetical protein
VSGPVLHTIIDELIPVTHESAYRETVAEVGRTELLSQAYASGVGHCNFTEAQVMAAVRALDTRVHTGVTPTAGSLPTALGFVPKLLTTALAPALTAVNAATALAGLRRRQA